MIETIMKKFRETAADPLKMKDKYLAEGRKIVLMAPVYGPYEIVHSMGFVPMGVWGADVRLNEAKRYYPAFICSIVQSITELGMRGDYAGASAIIIPGQCDSLKVLGENWKYAVPAIPYVPVVGPQNRRPAYARDFTRAGYERVISDLEKITGQSFSPAALQASLAAYNRHNVLMREVSEAMAALPQISARNRSAVFRSAFFMRVEEHTELLEELLRELKNTRPEGEKIRVVTAGILADAPALLQCFDDNGLQIVADDVAAESRQYRTDIVIGDDPLHDLADRFCRHDHCSVLYDPDKKRPEYIAGLAKQHDASGVILLMTKFCDPEEFDAPLVRRACEEAGLIVTEIETDRQMTGYEQAGTILETFREMVQLRREEL